MQNFNFVSAKALDCYHCGDWPYSANCLEHDAVLMTCPEIAYSSKTACVSTSMSVGNMKCTVFYDDSLHCLPSAGNFFVCEWNFMKLF